jgi:hypothetical protein
VLAFFRSLRGGRLTPKRRNIGLKSFLITRFRSDANAFLHAEDFLHAEYQEIGDHAKRLLFGVNTPNQAKQ